MGNKINELFESLVSELKTAESQYRKEREDAIFEEDIETAKEISDTALVNIRYTLSWQKEVIDLQTRVEETNLFSSQCGVTQEVAPMEETSPLAEVVEELQELVMEMTTSEETLATEEMVEEDSAMLEMVEEEPVMEEVAEEPVMEEVAEEPAMEEVVEEPVMEEVVEEPVMEEVAEEPVMEEVAEEPVMEEVAEEPVMEEVAEEPAMEEVAEEPAMEEVAEEPAMEEVTEEPAMEEVAEEPVMEEVAEEPAMEEVGEVASTDATLKVMLFDRPHPVATWSDVLVVVCEELIALKPLEMMKLPLNKELNTAERINFSRIEKDIKINGKKLTNGMWIEAEEDEVYIYETCCSLLLLCGFEVEDIKVTPIG